MNELFTASSSSSLLSSLTEREEMLKKRRKEVFGDCALIEIIHLHDCLRGAIRSLEKDVNDFETFFTTTATATTVELERRIAGRFRVIWSVFKSHSQAEDQFIWPALKTKTQGTISGSPNYIPGMESDASVGTDGTVSTVEQQEYEEDHADEERMFFAMDELLTAFRTVLIAESGLTQLGDSSTDLNSLLQQLVQSTRHLSEHLMSHLEKEEIHCLPLVVKYLTREEIRELVGDIMGQRSANMVVEIMTMAVQSLEECERQEMVKYMKESMKDTFFDRWLTMSGWDGTPSASVENQDQQTESSGEVKCEIHHQLEDKKRAASPSSIPASEKRTRLLASTHEAHSMSSTMTATETELAETSPSELERLIRVIATNTSLTSQQRNTTIQGLRDSIWKNNQSKKRAGKESLFASQQQKLPNQRLAEEDNYWPSTAPSGEQTDLKPPSMYFRKSSLDDSMERVWPQKTADKEPTDTPLFSEAELRPTYRNDAGGRVFGCAHYARGCKVRHPTSGKLYTCRMCCSHGQGERDEPLDRYDISEVLCMYCNTLQPANDVCVNADCGKPFAKYYCNICHLYDDGGRPIFHCPYCNACRLGKGLGIDYRHCMRCNACVSLGDAKHQCIPQKLQGCCPICHESLFESTEALRGLKCGHVMHLSCFTAYRRDHNYTCPLCMRSMEDMADYFALLDTAVQMQPMPPNYATTKSVIYCQDCDSTGQTTYHFVGQKCPDCGSYNTRELNRSS